MKEKFLELVGNIKRDGINNLLKWLEDSDWYTAPASSKYHCDYAGGLLEHSINVYNRLIRLYKMEYGDDSITDEILETLTIISLFHDLCKVNFYKVDSRNVKNENGVWEKVPYYSIDEKFSYGYHGAKSTFLAERFIKLTLEEAVSISNHMGAFDRPNGDYAIGQAFEQYPLSFLLHTADCLASFIDEKKEK